MKNEDGKIKVRAGNHPPWIGIQDQGISDFRWLVVRPNDYCAQLGGANPHASHADARSVTEPQMGGLVEDDIGQVSGLSHCLLG